MPSFVPAPVMTAATGPVGLVSASPAPAVGSRLQAASAAAAAAAAAGASPVTRLGEWHPPVAPPVSLTQGMPDPATVQRQKEGYVRTLDDQLRKGAVQLDTEHKQQRDLMHQAAEGQKKQFGMQIDQQVKMQEMDLDQQFLQVLQYVKQQATRQRAILEQQAMQLSFEYQEKKVEEDMLAHQFELSKHQQALKNQMLTNGPMSPLPSYMPVSSSTTQVPSNPYAANRLAATVTDATAPVLAYAPLGGGSTVNPGFVTTSYVPPVANAGPPITTTIGAPSLSSTPLAPIPTATVVAPPVTALPPGTILSPQRSAAVLPTVAMQMQPMATMAIM